MKIVFMGTPEFAAFHLRAIIEAKFDVIAVFTQPDRRKGRGRRIKSPPVKETASAFSIPVYQFNTINEDKGFATLASLKPDVIIVVAYGLILKKQVLDLPSLGCFNVHASLLPKYRGASPINRAIEHGERKTGITIIKMDEHIDTGAIALSKECAISFEDTFGSLHDKLMRLGAETLIEFLRMLEKGKVKLSPQDNDKATYAPKISKDELWIDWNEDGMKVFNKIRAYDPYPAARTRWSNDKCLKLFGAMYMRTTSDELPGRVLSISRDGIVVKTGIDGVLIREIQPEGGRKMSALDFCNGYHLSVGSKFS